LPEMSSCKLSPCLAPSHPSASPRSELFPGTFPGFPWHPVYLALTTYIESVTYLCEGGWFLLECRL
jgi:hypothetical protein